MSAVANTPASSIPSTFRAGDHEVRVWMKDGRWYAAVDGAELPIWHKVQADAWTAGVTEADRLDRLPR